MDPVRELVGEQRKRLIASILQHAEREVYPSLTPEQRSAFRTKVLESVGVYHDLVLDVIKVSNRDTVMNEEAVTLLRQIHRAVSSP